MLLLRVYSAPNILYMSLFKVGEIDSTLEVQW